MKKSLVCAALIVLFLMAACGYRFSVGGRLPGDPGAVTVLMFRNNTVESGAEALFTDALTDEILENADARVVDRNNADACIQGTIKSVSVSVLSRSADDSVRERRVAAVIDIEMKNTEGDLLWSAYEMEAWADYKVTASNTGDAVLQSDAVNRIARRLAEKAVSRMLDNF